MASPSERGHCWAEVRDLFLRFGYDIDNPRDIQRIRDELQWLSQIRAKAGLLKKQRAVFILSVFAALLGAVATTGGEFLLRLVSWRR